MQNHYNINQLTLSISTDWQPQDNDVAWQINDLVESLRIDNLYVFGRPREYDLAAMLKLIVFAYARKTFSSRQIELMATENLTARWLTQEQMPSYRTICRFRISNDVESLVEQGLDKLVQYLRKNNMITEATFIDGTKILADANKYSFVWKKNTIRFDQMNREAIVQLLNEINNSMEAAKLSEDSKLSLEEIDEVVIRLETQLEDLNNQIDTNPKLSPNPFKQQRRTIKSQKRKLSVRRDKIIEHQIQMNTFGQRNSYSKTDTDATFMRVKEDPMNNGQLKPAYNIQVSSSGQFVTGFNIFQNPTDTRTLIPFLEYLEAHKRLEYYIVADAGYGSEPNYRFIEDNLADHIDLIPYGTMLKEQSRKWQSDDKKIMNWTYFEKDDYYIDLNQVRFNFTRYTTKKDKYGVVRDFKLYTAEKVDENQMPIEAALTPKGNVRTISVNPSWEYFKNKTKEKLSNKDIGIIYGQRKIDVEPIFGRMKAYLHFNRFSVRGIEKVRKEMGLVITALNMVKLAGNMPVLKANSIIKNSPHRNLTISMWTINISETYVTASFNLDSIVL